MTLPIVHCFDRNYVLPAAVCFRSLLEHARTPGVAYAIYVIGRDLREADRELLEMVVKPFPNARLVFAPPPPLPDFSRAFPKKSHFSADLFYKLVLPEAFPELDKAVVADVDVVYQDDVAQIWPLLADEEPYELAGIWDLGYAAAHGTGLFPTGRPLVQHYLKSFTAAERDKLRIGAGMLVYNLKKLRAAGRSKEWLDFAVRNAARAILPEQEVFGLVRGDLIKVLPLRFMAVAEHAPRYDAMTAAERAANPAWDEMYRAPVQLHYASRIKPWKYPGSARAELWFAALARAGLVEEWRRWYADFSAPMVAESLAKRIFDVRLGRFRAVLSKCRKAARR